RHLRDIVITEYGIADLRGKQDWEVIAALLNITDSRFQNELLQRAKSAGKIPVDYRIPELFRENTPEKLLADLRPFRQTSLFPEFPFGSDFTPEELVLGKALMGLKQRTSNWPGRLATLANTLFARASTARYAPYLKRMNLETPASLRERFTAKLVAAALKRSSLK
ncbi:MAG: acetyl-CoA hydrolase/transferase C-terminal domain-containing protein, partial [Gammaproteobacteria bacterium]